MISVFTPKLTPRIDYAVRFIFESILLDEVQFYTQPEAFQNAPGVRINYSAETIPNCYTIVPRGLLLESHVEMQKMEAFTWGKHTVFFRVKNSDLPFDIFAASFFLVSRYEEYLPAKRDHYNRYRGKYSTAFLLNFLEKPQIDCWAQSLAQELSERFEGYTFKKRHFNYQPTIDIDNAYAYKGKGLIRSLAASAKDALNGRWKRIAERYSVIYRLSKDPYDNYDFIRETLNQFDFKPIYFFLLKRRGKHDRNLSHNNIFYRSLISRLKLEGQIGIHPSYISNKRNGQLAREIKRLRSISGEAPIRSRQHYLKLSMPKTYRSLLQNGIEHDYTMGYPTRLGFRASTCTPFLFFDLLDNKVTSLTIHPFAVMDVTLRMYNNLRSTEAVRKIKKLMDITAEVGGTFISIWHNESLSDVHPWAGWRDVYVEMTEWAAKLQNEA